MKMKKNNQFIAAFFGILILLMQWACGGGGNKTVERQFHGALVIQAVGDLPECDQETKGQLFYIQDELKPKPSLSVFSVIDEP